MEFASFFLSIVCAINMGAVIKNYKFKDAIIIIVIATVYVMALHGFVKYTDEVSPIEDWNVGQVTGMNNECIEGMGWAEYLPTKAFENRFYVATREDKIYALKGKAVVDEEQKDGLNMSAKIETFGEDVSLELPYIYYPGYEVRADGEILKTYETENGFLGCDLPSGDDLTLEVAYRGTDNSKVATIISVLGTLLLIIYIWKMEREK